MTALQQGLPKIANPGCVQLLLILFPVDYRDNRVPSPSASSGSRLKSSPICLISVYQRKSAARFFRRTFMSFTRDVVSTPNAPNAIGPYSQAIKANGFVFISGQVALDPATGNLI